MEWLARNCEWVFSGIGVALLGGLWGLIRYKRKAGKSQCSGFQSRRLKHQPIQLARSTTKPSSPDCQKPSCQKTQSSARILAPSCAHAPKLRTVKRLPMPQLRITQRRMMTRTPSWASGARRPTSRMIQSSSTSSASGSVSG